MTSRTVAPWGLAGLCLVVGAGLGSACNGPSRQAPETGAPGTPAAGSPAPSHKATQPAVAPDQARAPHTHAAHTAHAGSPPVRPAADEGAAALAGPDAQPAPAEAAHANMGHDPAHPPIDCPLRKRGIDPTKMRPFEEVEAYIAFLERPDRAVWQKPDEVVSALHLRGDESVYDLGAGSGYFSFRFAKALPEGRVVAGDTEAEMVRHIHHKAMMQGVDNLEARVIDPDDPAVPAGTSLVFVCDVLHHVGDKAAWLGKIARALTPGARLALIEFREGELPEGPPAAHKIPRAELIRLAEAAGFKLVREETKLLPYQVFLVFQAQARTDSSSGR